MSLSSLPEEIQFDIFLRLPLNSIGITRCVCKPFSSLLYSPRFLKNHHNIQINKNPRLLFKGREFGYDSGLYSMDFASISSSNSIIPKGAFVRMYYPDHQNDRFEVMGSCNGLVCLWNQSRNGSICLWNPLTGEYRKIRDPSSNPDDVFGHGFGYDCRNKDYKVVNLIGGSEAEVYTLGSDSWKVVQYERHPYACPHKEPSGLYFNGALHWLYITRKSRQIIVSFDLSSEIFTEFSLPEQPLDDQCCLGVLGSCLCLVYNNASEFDVWVMRDYGVKDSWIKQFSTAHELFTSITFRRPIWSFENGEVLMETSKGFVLIDPSKNKLRISGIHAVRSLVVRKDQTPNSYVESLVSLDSHTYVIKGENPMKATPVTFQESCGGAY